MLTPTPIPALASSARPLEGRVEGERVVDGMAVELEGLIVDELTLVVLHTKVAENVFESVPFTAPLPTTQYGSRWSGTPDTSSVGFEQFKKPVLAVTATILKTYGCNIDHILMSRFP